eukprot:gene7979-10050_t
MDSALDFGSRGCGFESRQEDIIPLTMDLLSAPLSAHVSDEPKPVQQIQRDTSRLQITRNNRFCVDSTREFEKQYSHVYFVRYHTFLQQLKIAALEKWKDKNVKVAKNILNIEPGHQVVVIGTLYKDMPLKPNILDDYHAQENYEAPPPERSKYYAPEDNLILEDMSGRIAISLTDALSVGTHVSGIPVALLGFESEAGEFQVEDVCYTGLGVQHRLPEIPTMYVCLVSGLNIGSADSHRMQLQLFVDFITGHLGGPEEQEVAAQILHVIVAGNLVSGLDDKHQDLPQYKKRTAIPESVAHMKEVDLLLAQLGTAVTVDMMPGEHDPSDAILPQQPMHPCMFPLSKNTGSVRGVTNPYEATLSGRHVLGTSGQGIDDIYRFSTEEDRLELLVHTLQWGHLFPTAPDSLGCFPYATQILNPSDQKEGVSIDPFAIRDCPHIYFAGNQPNFATRFVNGNNGQRVRVLTVPTFSKTHSAVLVDLATLECEEISFKTYMTDF